ncbi:hypothetical protein DL93DRAFT_2088373 [Clavulina sp. PMI_390]|nr:hypothetical protein DL93DRAFT_2088373 [Clavulina sp. PMI_390]
MYEKDPDHSKKLSCIQRVDPFFNSRASLCTVSGIAFGAADFTVDEHLSLALEAEPLPLSPQHQAFSRLLGKNSSLKP